MAVRLPDLFRVGLGRARRLRHGRPAVFDAVGIDAERYTGFAWGFGIDRLAAARTNLADLRELLDNDVRFLKELNFDA